MFVRMITAVLAMFAALVVGASVAQAAPASTQPSPVPFPGRSPSLAFDARGRIVVAYALESEGKADRVAVLKSIETTPFFAKVRGDMVVALYNQPEVWAKLGYEGASAEYGGYIHRGFEDIDWIKDA